MIRITPAPTIVKSAHRLRICVVIVGTCASSPALVYKHVCKVQGRASARFMVFCEKMRPVRKIISEPNHSDRSSQTPMVGVLGVQLAGTLHSRSRGLPATPTRGYSQDLAKDRTAPTCCRSPRPPEDLAEVLRPAMVR